MNNVKLLEAIKAIESEAIGLYSSQIAAIPSCVRESMSVILESVDYVKEEIIDGTEDL